MSSAEIEKKVEMVVDEEKSVYTPGPNAIDVTPGNDGGVLKEIITEGSGTETPLAGNKVFVHYTGKLLDGTVFDSSRDRDVFDFTLGRDQVIKAWDLGVSTMKKGEICMLTCNSEYAYGKAGSPPKIPPDSTLVFEVELIRWQLEDLSLPRDGGILRTIITKGEGDDKPNDDATVEVHIIGKYDGKIFEDREVTFQLGEGIEHGIVSGIEIAVKNFLQGETSLLNLSPQYAFQQMGNSKFNIPPNSKVDYEVTLKSFEKAKEIWSMSSEEKLKQSELVKNKGTKYFKEEKYLHASRQYKKIINYLQYETDLQGDEAKEKKALLLAGYLNVAACHLKLNNFEDALKDCEKAVEIEPNNAKAFFRMGQAYFSLNDFDCAKKNFLRVIEIEPNNKAAQKRIYGCNEKLKQQLEKERKIYRNMFEKLARDSKEVEQIGEPDATTVTEEAKVIGDL